MKKLIYFLEDDESINTLLGATLDSAGFDYKGFLEPMAFIASLSKETPDLIVLDLMLPSISGFDILEMLKDKREFENIPVIVLSAKAEEKDIVKALDMGASDYITKPFGLREFISRVNANIRKVNMRLGKPIQIRNIKVDPIKHQVFYKDKIVPDITTKEFEILVLLFESPSVVVTRSKLLKTVWGYAPDTETRTLDMHIKTIREKIGRLTDEEYVETVRGVGFIVNE